MKTNSANMTLKTKLEAHVTANGMVMVRFGAEVRFRVRIVFMFTVRVKTWPLGGKIRTKALVLSTPSSR